jgi:DNA-binding response OmpR family regulator
LERIKIHFRNQDENEVLTLGTIEINVGLHQVLTDGNIAALTQREFELFYYLIKNKGKVCTRTQIIEDVWDIHFDYDTGVIDVFMNSIRKKLNLKKEDDYIKTIRGIGYIANEIL